MRSDFVQVDADADLWRAQQLMLGADQEALLVEDGERLHGMLTGSDIRAALAALPWPITGEAPKRISSTATSL